MIDSERALAINRAGWDRVAAIFHGGTALPEPGNTVRRLRSGILDLRARMDDRPSQDTGARRRLSASGRRLRVQWRAPAYRRFAWDGKQYIMAEPYTAEGSVEYTSWKGVPIVIQHRTLGTFITEIARAGLRIEALVEGELNPDLATDVHADPARWYSVPRARMMPTTFIIKARKPWYQGFPKNQNTGEAGGPLLCSFPTAIVRRSSTARRS